MLLDLNIDTDDLEAGRSINPIQYDSVDTAATINIDSASASSFEDARSTAYRDITTEAKTKANPTVEEGSTPAIPISKEVHIDEANYTPDYSDISADDASFLTALGKVESNNNYYAKPNGSGYEGKYQFRFRAKDDGTKYAKALGITHEQWRKSPQLQEKHMQYVLKHDYDNGLKRYKIPVNNYTRWLRHNMGLGGTRAIIRGKLTKNIRRNIRNQGVKGSTDSELINNYHKKFRHRFTSTKRRKKRA